MTRIVQGVYGDIDWEKEVGPDERACEETACRVVGTTREMVTDGNAWYCPPHGGAGNSEVR